MSKLENQLPLENSNPQLEAMYDTIFSKIENYSPTLVISVGINGKPLGETEELVLDRKAFMSMYNNSERCSKSSFVDVKATVIALDTYKNIIRVSFRDDNNTLKFLKLKMNNKLSTYVTSHKLAICDEVDLVLYTTNKGKSIIVNIQTAKFRLN